MRFYRFTDPEDFRYASAGRRGTWAEGKDLKLKGRLCPVCTATGEERIRPLVIEWEPGSDLVGDFTSPGFNDELVVSSRAVTLFKEHGFKGYELGPVQTMQAKHLKRPQRLTRRTKRRVWLPYEGPALWDLWVTASCSLGLQRSGVTPEKVCATCGAEFYNWPRSRIPFVIDPRSWSGQQVFKMRPFTAPICITADVKRAIEDAGLTNFGCEELGFVGE